MIRYSWQDWFGLRGCIEQPVVVFLLKVFGAVIVMFALGIFVDVIAQDYTANSVLGQKLHMKLSLLARGLLFKKWSGGSAAAVKGKGYAIFDTIKNCVPL